MRPLSVVIITFNEEQNIARCIGSVSKLAEEIIVLDSYSTDDTVAIAKSMGARVCLDKFKGYIDQKNSAIQLASHDLILSLDADEALDEELAKGIELQKKTNNIMACTMNRCTSYCGHFIKHGLWYPDRKLRLFDRRIAQWGGLNPHDKILLAAGTPVKHLSGNILHYSFSSAEELVWQNNRLSSIAAASLYAAGKRTNLFRIMIHPLWAFFNGYFLRKGFMDGFDGWTIAVHSAYQVFMKHSKLYGLQRTHLPAKVKPLPKPEEKKVSLNI